MSVAPSPTPQKLDKETLIKRIKNLGPWHMNIQLTDELNTGQVFVEGGVKRGRENGGRGGDVSLLSYVIRSSRRLTRSIRTGCLKKLSWTARVTRVDTASGLANAMLKRHSVSMFANTGSNKRDL